MKVFEGKRILVTGGTGSLGKVLVRRLLSGANGRPEKIIVFSRDEAKQHFMRVEFQRKKNSTDEIIFRDFENILEFFIGDVRDSHALSRVLSRVDVVINAAALKQVPACEYHPYEAVQTNIQGAENIIRVIHENAYAVDTVVGVSTDKACKPVNVMGMTKAIQERIFISANLTVPDTRWVCVRYGNVLASRGSVIPLFHEQIENGGPLTITTPEMTRFLLSLEDAVDTIVAAIAKGNAGDTLIPRIPSARVVDIADVLIGERKIEIMFIGLRPGEKVHEAMISEEEVSRVKELEDYYLIQPMLPELRREGSVEAGITKEYSSEHSIMNKKELYKLLHERNLLIGQEIVLDGEFLR